MEDRSNQSRYESPLRYPGGKACLFPFVSKLFHENNLIGTNYAEPYAGGAGLALKLLFNEYVNKIFINDLDYAIFSFWTSLMDSNGRFCDWLETVEVSIENWKYYKHISANSSDFSNFEIAQAFFFLNRTNISGVIKGGVIGGINQHGKYKIDARFNRDDLIKRIQRIEQFKDRIIISNLDGLKFVKRLNKMASNYFIYLDPPYVHKGSELYMNYFKANDHKLLAKTVDYINHKWLVSYDHNGLVLDLYQKHRRVVYKLSQSASNRVGEEVLIFSDPLQVTSSLNMLTAPVLVTD